MRSFIRSSVYYGCKTVEVQSVSRGTGICNNYTVRINHFVNINNLENKLLPSVELLFQPDDTWIFQQEGALAHTAHSVSDWFKKQNIKVLPWCAIFWKCI
ncbi:hypothetical protein BpHYR1_009670 [Brachionus plicatilis]|uniref:Uncharacterized protein n=1 Tax=Brachionus plicatilis TaxID=10195 RepID=A0A3M7SKB1_BRAPC|nr:hypothetical protein BpHYR1_009670 [Brachionus plicatilis]